MVGRRSVAALPPPAANCLIIVRYMDASCVCVGKNGLFCVLQHECRLTNVVEFVPYHKCFNPLELTAQEQEAIKAVFLKKRLLIESR
eukprot:COSAG02_NODE_299_length_25349_cov_53.762020_1_plen_87_part_00